MHLAAAIALSIIHVMSGCHVFGTAAGAPLGANRTIVTHVGGRVQIRITCPMDFDVSNGQRWMTGTMHTLSFKKRGVYRFTFTNVQTPEERGLETLGPTNTPKLTVIVR